MDFVAFTARQKGRGSSFSVPRSADSIVQLCWLKLEAVRSGAKAMRSIVSSY